MLQAAGKAAYTICASELKALLPTIPLPTHTAPATVVRALSALGGLCEERLRAEAGNIASHSQLLKPLLLARKGAAVAATQLSQSKGQSSELSPSQHCDRAEAAVRLELTAGSSAAETLLSQLVDVFAAAAQPLRAVRLGLEVASGQLRVDGPAGGSAVAAAMSVSNQAGLPLGTVLMLEELLIARGKVEDEGVVVQVES